MTIIRLIKATKPFFEYIFTIFPQVVIISYLAFGTFGQLPEYSIWKYNFQNRATFTAFEEMKREKSLRGEKLDIVKMIPLRKCGLLCHENEKCRSFNFCKNRTCELNREDVYSTVEGVKLLDDNPGWNFRGVFLSLMATAYHKK